MIFSEVDASIPVGRLGPSKPHISMWIGFWSVFWRSGSGLYPSFEDACAAAKRERWS